MVCPLDAQQCVSHYFRGVTYDQCPECFGVWFDRDELKSFILSANIAKPDMWPLILRNDGGDGRTPPVDFWNEGKVSCPHGDGLLSKHYFAGTTIGLDHCLVCGGYWFNGGELKAAIQETLPDRRQDAMGALVMQEFTAPAVTMLDSNNPLVPDSFEGNFRSGIERQILDAIGNWLSV
jgi:Zn-finger nucleic acid-binding protein